MISEKLRNDARPIWNRIFSHPFVVELYSGKLPFEKFRYYILQDYAYLIGVIRAFSIISAKSEIEISGEILEIARMEATTEIENYRKLLNRMNLTMEDAIKTEVAPTNLAYVNFIISTSFLGNEYEGLASLLPCFWSYLEIWKRNSHLLEKNENEIYIQWAKEYGSKEYQALVKKLINLMDRAVGNYEKLRKIFLTGSRYEYAFWEMAYTMERWHI